MNLFLQSYAVIPDLIISSMDGSCPPGISSSISWIILRKSGDGTLSGTKYIWLYTEKNLPRKYRKIFSELKNSDLKTARAYSKKENLRNLWNCTTVEETKEFWKRWYFWATHSRLDPVMKKAGMIRDHLSGVMAYFTYRITRTVMWRLNSRHSWLLQP